MTNNSPIQLFEKAISSDENQQIEFIRRIPEILNTFPQNWIISKFLPFFINWLPKNNEKMLLTLIQYVPQFITAVGSIKAAGSLIEAILMSENQKIERQLISPLLQFKNDPTCNEFIDFLASSKYDCVRSFVPLIIKLACYDDYCEKNILPSLAYDPSFRVRKASLQIVESIPNQELATNFAYTFTNDVHSGIRAHIPIVLSHLPFYAIHILPKIQEDPDWLVRASVAHELVKCPDSESAIQSCISLAADKVWQVRFYALKSLLALLPGSKPTSIDQDFFNLLIETIKFPQPSLKKCVIDFLLILFAKQPTFTDIIMTQDPETKLYFLSKAIQRKKLKLLIQNPSQILEIIKDIAKSEKWLVRKTVIDIFIDIAKNIQDQDIINQLTELCLTLLKDEAAPVRESAAIQLAAFTNVENIEQNFPQFLIELEESDYFRYRQAAIDLLHALFMKASSQSTKEFLISHIRKFTRDPIQNVVEYANYVLNKTE